MVYVLCIQGESGYWEEVAKGSCDDMLDESQSYLLNGYAVKFFEIEPYEASLNKSFDTMVREQRDKR